MVIVLDSAHVHMLYVVYVHGGCVNLVGCLRWGKIEWLKSLSISEGMLRIFNSSMIIVLDGAHVSCLI